MKEKLLKIIEEIVELLIVCDREIDVDWFKSRAEQIKKLDINSREFRKILIEIDGNIAGMGSFSDIPMYPKKDASLSRLEASRKQYDLGVRLGNAIEEILKTLSLAK